MGGGLLACADYPCMELEFPVRPEPVEGRTGDPGSFMVQQANREGMPRFFSIKF